MSVTAAYCHVMAEYSHWMNQNLYRICASIPDCDRRRDLGAFFQSIHGTLNHILFGDRVWLGRLTGKPSGHSVGEELYADFDELRRQQEVTDREILAWCEQLTDDWLVQPFVYSSTIYQQTRVLPTWVLVTHMFNHQTHHRGQLTTLLKQLGYEPGITDLPWMPSLAAYSADRSDMDVTHRPQ